MKALGEALRRLLARPAEKSAPPALPEEIDRLLAGKKAHGLKPHLQAMLQQDRDAPAFAPLLAAAEGRGWPPQELEKLRILRHYYRGEYAQAARALAHVEDAESAGDFIGIAAASLYHAGRREEAYRLVASLAGERERAAWSDRDFPLIVAAICWATGHFDAMKRAIDEARRIHPDSTAVALNAYAMYFELGDTAAVEGLRNEFAQGRYVAEEAANTLALVELAQDRYARGFELLEWRYKREAGRFSASGLPAQARWHGQPLAGSALLVVAEQGLGDTIQMARYLPLLASAGAGRVAVQAQAEALPLLRHNFPAIEFSASGGAQTSLPAFDSWTTMLGLPHAFGTVAENVPGRQGYLTVPDDSAAYWNERVAELTRGQRPRIGLAWSGNPRHHADLRRSVPFARMMAAIRDVDADFFAVQTHVPAGRASNLIDVAEEMVTLADTAALIAEMDLVITVDTSVVHVAGALGKETWLLLPHRYEWRWGLEGEGNRWYDSVKVLRQRSHGDWDGLLADVFKRRLPERARV